MAKPVFATNFDTVHRIACFKRDVHNDKSDFEKINGSEFSDAVHNACQQSMSLKSWWAPDNATLFNDGHVEVIVRTCDMDDKMDDENIRFVRINFQYCKPEDVSQLVEREKGALN